MAHRSDDVDLVRSVGSPLVDEDTEKCSFSVNNDGGGGGGDGGDNCEDLSAADNGDDDADLPQCKIKRNYSCSLCPFFSQNPRLFLYHSRDVHFDRIKIFECSQCLYASKHSQKLQRHINMIHVAGKSKVKKTHSKGIKIEVKKELRPIKPKPLDSFQELTPKNSKQNETNSSILKNILQPEDQNLSEGEVGEGEFKCSVCNFKNKNQKLMRRHEKIVHLKKKFLRCSKCSYVTHVKARYTKHVKYHSMPMIKCNLCDFRTPYKWNLDRHYKNHCGTGAFQCSKCNFRADIKQSLTVHEMNHHVPPVGQGAIMARKKNKVGASEIPFTEPEKIDKKEFEQSKMETEDSGAANFKEKESKEEDNFKDSVFQNIRNVKLPYTNKRESANNNHFQTDFIHPDDIVPRYGQIYVKNLKCKFCSYKAVFSHEIWRHEKRIHGYIRPESRKENVPKRPPPKLIPIQNKSATVTSISSPILKIPALKTKVGSSSPEIFPGDKSVNESEFNEMCKNSCLTSSLKDFVSLIGDEEGLKTIPDSSRENLEEECLNQIVKHDETDDFKGNDLAKQKQIDFLKKKNESFFDKLKEKLMTGSSEEQSLFCENCGFKSKCLSEAAAHQKRHSSSNFKNDSDNFSENDIILSGAELSSTRCQHCRQRCKTSTDLYNHLKSCKAFSATFDSQPNSFTNEDDFEIKIKTEEPSCEEEKLEKEENSMENRVFVWNNLSQRQEGEEEEGIDFDNRCNDDYLLDTSIYGAVTSKGSDNTESGTMVLEVDSRLNLTVKKVFKCPHCSFWASTASRFHVHIVGHLNKKPFECSLCLYRSNWRWDITKHIRLKSARDPSHLEAQVNMTDETGRRNYSKYNKYLTMMKVQEPSAESSGTGRRSKPSEATQGNITEGDIIPLPAPPRLTRAPTPGISQKILQGVPLRPPPPLKAAHHIPSQSKALSFKQTSAKKTLWKCKKCNFRDSNKSSVLAHVKGHYSKKANNSMLKSAKSGSSIELSTSIDDSSFNEKANFQSLNFSAKTPAKTPSYKCGHCQQVSNWKHVIQRHCKLKHNGDAFIQVGWKEEPTRRSSKSEENHDKFQSTENSIELISCDICPFTTDTEGDLTAHKLNHIDRPGSIFKCSYCPFYVPSKIAVIEHMEIHGVNERCDLTSLKVDNFDPSECNEEFSMQNCGSSSESSKRYKCRQCPYLSNSRTQFLYHKQFHRPRDAPFKCMYCSYNVSRRHLLHQHLRVHHNQEEIFLKKDQFSQNSEQGSFCDINTFNMTEIPLVWVLKTGNFHKMFKCRWCPHVNIRKINIQEHEKMHKTNDESNSAKEEGNQSSIKLRCPDCNYTCNNAGVLASHIKVHQGYYGEIRCLVDSTKSDIDQIRELQKSLKIIEPEVVIKEETNFAIEILPKISKEVEEEPMTSHPENAYTNKQENVSSCADNKKVLNFCNKCPARFFFKKELRIHSKFHMISLPFQCAYCTYTARQRPHLLAHYKVHTEEYQEKTVSLVKNYSVSTDSPQPETVSVINDSQVIEGPVWTVANLLNSFEEGILKQEESSSKPISKLACHRCPAKFFKSVALQYHLTHHGSSHQYKCKYCDYSVKTYENLIKHQLVHEESKNKIKKSFKFSYEFPISEIDLHQQFQENTNQLSEEQKPEEESLKQKTDPQFGNLIHGSPNFIYPTYLKNGKLKEKKYKCHKCPSAFEKREQYRIHLSLHGSKQKYSCEKCDYSVKYYANYVQHKRKHQSHEIALIAKNSDTKSSTSSEIIEKTNSLNLSEYTFSEKQALFLRNRKKFVDGLDDKKMFDCFYCPYTSNRRDAFENHKKRHFQVSNIRFEFICSYCDYSTPQKNFLREHNKLHFSKNLRFKAEAYLKVEKMELWCCEEKRKNEGPTSDSNILIFQDRGEDAEDRFFPPLKNEDDDKKEICKLEILESTDSIEKNIEEPPSKEDFVIFNYKIDLLNLKKNVSLKSPLQLQNDDIIEMVEESCDKKTGSLQVEKAKPKMKRWRGKNWKCKKCPHAFGKKDQYLRHVALHGSNQKHNCDICDYSVKFYTNYVQHMRMHQMHEPNKIIFVKKNYQSFEESTPQYAISNESETLINQGEIIMSKTSESRPEESDSLSSGEKKQASDKYEDTDPFHDYFSSTDGTEASSFFVENNSLVTKQKAEEVVESKEKKTENFSSS